MQIYVIIYMPTSSRATSKNDNMDFTLHFEIKVQGTFISKRLAFVTNKVYNKNKLVNMDNKISFRFSENIYA